MIEMTDIWKSYGPVDALRGASLVITEGRVTALVGENGAGKSTMVKIVSGVERYDRGVFKVDGQVVESVDVRIARRLGIETVYQDLALAEELNVAHNVFLGREIFASGLGKRLRILDRVRMRQETAEILAKLSGNFGPDRLVSELSGGQRQMVAFAKALKWGRQAIILDEPTAALGVEARRVVLDTITKMREAGIGLLLVSHSMPEVFAVADIITVLRHGRTVMTRATNDITMEEVIGFMTGAIDDVKSAYR